MIFIFESDWKNDKPNQRVKYLGHRSFSFKVIVLTQTQADIFIYHNSRQAELAIHNKIKM